MPNERRLENIINGFCQLKPGKRSFYKGLVGGSFVFYVGRGMIYEPVVYGPAHNSVLWQGTLVFAGRMCVSVCHRTKPHAPIKTSGRGSSSCSGEGS